MARVAEPGGVGPYPALEPGATGEVDSNGQGCGTG